MKDILLILWLAMNAFTFCLYGIDKYKAKHGAWRIPEKTLLTFTWLLGGVGALAGMRVFHHKTRHRVFAVSAPLAAGNQHSGWNLVPDDVMAFRHSVTDASSKGKPCIFDKKERKPR